MLYKNTLLLFTAISFSTPLLADKYDYGVIELYTQDELNVLVANNQHLQQVKKDDCQLVQDIEAHALKIKEPTYVYLWGDMLAWGVCVDRNPELGFHYIEEAAKQGLAAAIEQLGRYYEKGTLVQVDKRRAITFYREAALQGFLNAQINYVRMLNEGYGSPVDYEDAYRALFHSVIGDKKRHKKVQKQLAKLAVKMPENIVRRARMEPI